MAAVALAFGAVAARGVPTGFAVENVGPTLTNPTNIEFAPNGRVFVAEHAGLLKTWPSLQDFESSQNQTVFADLRTNVHGYWDRGLLGLAVHPEFPTVPYVYVLYTYDAPPGETAPTWGSGCPNATPSPGDAFEGCVVTGRLSRLTASPSGATMIGNEHVMIHDWCQQFPSHSIGDIKFGSDGALYVTAGEGASFHFTDWGQHANPCGDPPGGDMVAETSQGGALRSQSPRSSANPISLDGTVLRIDPITGEALPNNPWISESDPNRRRVVGYGLRNPFRFAIKPGTNQLFIGDVGPSTWEELNFHPNVLSEVRNYGWPCYEGGFQSGAGVSLQQGSYGLLGMCQLLFSDVTSGQAVVTAPLFAYRHNQSIAPGSGCPTGGGNSISGLAFYTSGGFPGSFNGALFGSDYSRRCIWVMFPDEAGNPDPSTVQEFHRNTTSGDNGSVDLAMGPDGNMYYVHFHFEGNIRRFRFIGGNTPPVAVISPSTTTGVAPLAVTLDGSDSYDPDQDDIVAYDWDLDGDGLYDDATGAVVEWVFPAGSHNVGLRVTDHRGETGTTQVLINASNTAPTSVIDFPAAGTQWSVGDEIVFSGHATDEQQGTIPVADLTWNILLHHCELDASCHNHPLMSLPGVPGGSFVAPDHEYPTWIEIRLTAVDEFGLATTVARELMPNKVALTFDTNPAGLDLLVAGVPETAPHSATFVVGATVEIAAPSPQESASTGVWVFTGWSQGGVAAQSITAPTTNTTYTASFTEELGEGSGASFGLVDPTSGQWFLRDPVTGATTSFYYGIPGDFPIVGDWNCNGVATPGMYRQSTGFVYLRNSNSQGIGDRSFFFGIPGDIPLVGDFNGDGCDTVSIYRPSQQRFYITNQLGSADQGFVAEFSFVFGNPGDKPFTGDFDNDGRTEVGLHRESTGLVYFRYTLTTGFADAQFFFGNPGDRLIAGNWTQSGTPGPETVGLFRPSNNTFYLRFDNSQGNADFSFGYGLSHMIPVAGHFGDLPGGAPAPGLP